MSTSSMMQLKSRLDEHLHKYMHAAFVLDDPICIPHQFTHKEDIEIAGFFAAILSWGQRKTIISKANALMELMDGTPHAFLMHATEQDLKRFQHFRHRTFQPDDFYAIFNGLRMIYLHHGGLEGLLTRAFREKDAWHALGMLHETLFSYPHLPRSRKHISNPATGSACKRLNMFLRWMVRPDEAGVDFGIWKGISAADLLCPLDVHVANTARKLKLLNRKLNDRKAVDELMTVLRKFDPQDPVKYDFALFGMSKYEVL